ncbi:glycerophosphodiester phosphodiesterase [Thalassoglobus polymorphus]|uniref:glycerophosphodiester phosphodiesterase n=1 Tax=Thalassoglobus polymorphus TaxID=2527994 RepID=A0A517QSL0_9PLAN|nr:glycerophosphodiester phosphodiesterase [Thalassoglobus polymorphus]QDT34601.1 Glycerophosphoryl diester phosphodiesterase precursor [Thalassoglobus polymorphus]
MQGVRQVQVIAHRGASGYLPEHTLEAKAMAYAMGADYLEQDVVLTQDDVAVVMHDIHLDTISDVAAKFPDRNREDGRYYAIDFTFNEIQQLQASERFNAKTGKAYYPKRFPVRSGSFKIPSLAEELELIQGLNKSTGKNVGIYPELKHPKFHHSEGKDLAKVVLDTLEKFGYTKKSDPCFVQCFEESETKRLKAEFNCKLKTVQLLSNKDWMSQSKLKEERNRQLKEIASFAEGIGPIIDSVFRKDPMGGTPIPTELTVNAHQHGLVVHPWTYRVDSVAKNFETFEQMHEATVLAGIDAIFSDFPDKSVELLKMSTKS